MQITRTLAKITILIFTVITSIAFGTYAYSQPGFPHIQLIAGKYKIVRKINPQHFPGCTTNQPILINSIRKHAKVTNEEIVLNLDGVTSSDLNWRITTADNTPFYIKYQTDEIYSTNIQDLNEHDLENSFINPLTSDLKTKGFKVSPTNDIPAYVEPELEYVRRIGFTKTISVITEDPNSPESKTIEGIYLLEIARYPINNEREKFKQETILTLNCKEANDIYNYEQYREIYNRYASSVKTIEKDSVITLDPSYLTNHELPIMESKLFAFKKSIQSDNYKFPTTEIWTKNSDDSLKLVQTINTKPNCSVLSKNDVSDLICNKIVPLK